MRTLLIIIIVLCVSVAAAFAGGCFFKYSYISGMNKICIYDCIEGERAITIDSYRLCPLSL